MIASSKLHALPTRSQASSGKKQAAYAHSPPTTNKNGNMGSEPVTTCQVRITHTPPRNQQELGRKATLAAIQTHHTNHMHTMTTIPLHHSTGVMTGMVEEKEDEKMKKENKMKKRTGRGEHRPRWFEGFSFFFFRYSHHIMHYGRCQPSACRDSILWFPMSSSCIHPVSMHPSCIHACPLLAFFL